MTLPRFLLRYLLALPLMLVFLPCSAARTTRVPAVPGAAEAHEVHLLLRLEGSVHLKRQEWSGYHPAAFGAVLRRGDLLRLSRSGKAVVLCDSLTLWHVPGGVSGLANGCPPPEEPVLQRDLVALGGTRSGLPPQGPLLLSPRQTRLLHTQPTLRWRSVPGATRYLVSLSESGRLVWQTEVPHTEVVYPGSPALYPKATYRVTVQASDGPFAGIKSVGPAFTLLSPQEAARVRASAEKLARLAISSAAQALAQAYLYRGFELRAEAIDILDKVVKAGHQAGALYQMLGHLSRQIGVLQEAERYYTAANRLADTVGDIEGQALAQTGLGRVYIELGQPAHAATWFERALAGYKKLGDRHRVDETSTLLERARTP